MGSKQWIMSAFLQGAPSGPTRRTGHVERPLLKGAMSQHVAGKRDRGEKRNGSRSLASLRPEPAGHKRLNPLGNRGMGRFTSGGRQVLSHAIVAGIGMWGVVMPGGGLSPAGSRARS